MGQPTWAKSTGRMWGVMDESASRDVADSVASWQGFPPEPAGVISREGSGWVARPPGRSNAALAISSDGAVATFPISVVRASDAVELLEEVSRDVVRTWADIVAGRGGLSADQAKSLIVERLALESGEGLTVEQAPGGYLVRSRHWYALSVGMGTSGRCRPTTTRSALRSAALPSIVAIAQRLTDRR